MSITLMNYIHTRFEASKVTRALTIYWMSTTGLSYLLGSVLGGVLIRTFGIVRVYNATGITGMAIAIFFSLIFAAFHKRTSFTKR